MLYVRSGCAFFRAAATSRAWICASVELRVPMLTWGNCVLVEVSAACGAFWDGVSRFVAVAEAIVRFDVCECDGNVL
jgi:hypothetical protein